MKIVGAGTTFSLAGCLGSISSEGGPIKVGVLLPLSGGSGELGQSVRDTVDLANEEVVNKDRPDLDPLVTADGVGLSGQDNREVEIVGADTRTDPNGGQTEAERLIQNEDVELLVGAVNSGVTKTISRVAERNQVPHVTMNSIQTDLTDRGLEWFWRVTPSANTYMRNQFQFMRDLNNEQDPDIETVAIVHEDGSFGSSLADEQASIAEEFGQEVIERISYTASSLSSFTSQVDVLQDADPDAIMLSSLIPDGEIIFSSMQDKSYYPKLVTGAGGLFSRAFWGDLPELSYDMVTNSTFSPSLASQIPELQRYNQMYKDVAGNNFGDQTSRAFAGYLTALAGIDRAEEVEGSAIQNALNNLELSNIEAGTAYGVKFDDTGQNTEGYTTIQQIQQGEMKIVWPFDIAPEENLHYPATDWDDR